MKKIELINKAKKLQKTERTTLNSLIKEILVSELEFTQAITTDGFKGERFSDGSAFIYNLDDCFVVLIDTDDEDFIYYTKQIDKAQKIATDKLYEHTFALI